MVMVKPHGVEALCLAIIARLAFAWRHWIAPRPTEAHDFRFVAEDEPPEVELNGWFVGALLAVSFCLVLLALQLLNCTHASNCSASEIWLNELILKLFSH